MDITAALEDTSKFQFIGYDDPAQLLAIKQAITTIYNASPEIPGATNFARNLFDDWFADPANENEAITIEYRAGELKYSFVEGHVLFDVNELLDVNKAPKLAYIDNNGNAVAASLEAVLAHELVHYLKGLDDSPPLSSAAALKATGGHGLTDYQQPTVTYTNKIHRQLGIPERNSYFSLSDIGAFLEVGKQYTGGAPIDRSVVLDTSEKVGFPKDWDTSAAGNSKDLLIGGIDNNTLKAGAGNDFLYGNGGNDTLDGGVNDDFLYGNEGDDILIGDLRGRVRIKFRQFLAMSNGSKLLRPESVPLQYRIASLCLSSAIHQCGAGSDTLRR